MKLTTLFAFFLLLFSITVCAQEIDVNRKTGLVTVNGKEYCYIQPASKGAVKQFNVQNLQHQDLIFISENEGRQYDRETQSFVGDDYRIVFLGTHNWCTAKSDGIGFNNFQKIARLLVKEQLLQDNAVLPESERLFIRKNHGIFATRIEPATRPVRPSSATTPKDTSNASFVYVDMLDGDKFLRNGKVVGTYSRAATTPETIHFYSADDVKVATAVRRDDEWELSTNTDGKKVTLRYYSTGTIDRLFGYLLQRGYLK
jgi:hypothetical protein